MHRPPAGGGAMGSDDTPLNCWNIDRVASWLGSLGLPQEVQDSFKRNAVDGGAAVLQALLAGLCLHERGCSPVPATGHICCGFVWCRTCIHSCGTASNTVSRRTDWAER